jgi:hypothetical protein
MTFNHGSKDPMQAVLGVAVTFAVVILGTLALGYAVEIVAKKLARDRSKPRR